MTEPLPLTLKWRRSFPDLEHYHAKDPERCKDVSVARIWQQNDSIGRPIDEWHWTMCAPGEDYKTRGTSTKPREAAYAAEQAYFRHMETVDPERFRLDLVREQAALEAQRNARY